MNFIIIHAVLSAVSLLLLIIRTDAMEIFDDLHKLSTKSTLHIIITPILVYIILPFFIPLSIRNLWLNR